MLYYLIYNTFGKPVNPADMMILLIIMMFIYPQYLLQLQQVLPIMQRSHAGYQRILNDLQRTRIFRGRMIWLLPNSLPTSPVSKLDRRHTWRLWKRDTHNLLTREGGGGRGGGGEEQIIRLERSPVLYNHSVLSPGYNMSICMWVQRGRW